MSLPRRPVTLFCLCILFSACSSTPLTSYSDASLSSPDHSSVSTNAMFSWLWGFVWGDDSTVTVVDRTPALSFPARPAAFGPISDVLGYLIRIEDFSAPCGEEDGVDWPQGGHGREWLPGGGEVEYDETARDARHGCPPLCVHGPHEPETSETWIALVMRGGCQFVDKVRHAQRFGAKGVVVGGETSEQDQHGDGLVQMYSIGGASDVTIPSTYISHASYNTLSSLIASSNTSTWGLRTVSVGMISDPSGWEWYSPLVTFVILLFLPSSLTLFTLFVHRIRAARAARRERAPEDVVLNLPWRIWEGRETLWELEKTLDAQEGTNEGAKDGQADTDVGEPSTSQPRESTEADILEASEAARKWYETQVECAICLEEFAKGDKIRVLPCRHIFHMDEVDDWLIHRKKLCPICKHDVTRPIGQHSRDSSSMQSLVTRPTSPSPPEQSLPDPNLQPSERTPLLR